MFGAEVAGEVITGTVGFVTLMVVGVASWSLKLLVRMSQILSRIEERTEDHDRRISDLERR